MTDEFCFKTFYIVVSLVGEAAEAIGYLGGVNHILEAMKKFPNNPELCSTCCHALWSLSVNGRQK